MGLFSNMFGGKQDYPELESNSPVKDQLAEIQAPLEELMGQVKDPMEVVPCGERTYVFIGKPPKRFGVVWIEDGEVKNFQLLAKEQGISPVEMQKVSAKLEDAYEQNQDVERFKTKVAGREIVVTPSPDLGQDVQQIVSEVVP